MGLNDYEFSDYGSGSSIESCLSWGDGMGTRQLSDPAFYRCRASSPRPLPIPQKRNSIMDGLQINSIDAVMQEFRMNGLDSPYDPEEEKWSRQADKLSGMGPSSAYVRQKSWPEPDATPALRLPSRGPWTPTPADVTVVPAQTPVPVHVPHETPNASSPTDMITEEQVRALNTIPNVVLYALLRDLEAEREVSETKRRRPVAQECRFCKNNGERESYYRSHALKDGAGRVCCPVLRAFACSRCGARGDSAHTLKYCPLTPAAERIKSAAMMRSVRHTALRRRSVPPSNEFVLFGQTPPSVIQDTQNMYDNNQLQPEWAALLQKLTL